MPPSGVDYASRFLNGYAPEYVHYPIILINGIILPQEYVVSDLQYLGLDFFNKDFKI